MMRTIILRSSPVILVSRRTQLPINTVDPEGESDDFQVEIASSCAAFARKQIEGAP
jgi:hypothetical protein